MAMVTRWTCLVAESKRGIECEIKMSSSSSFYYKVCVMTDAEITDAVVLSHIDMDAPWHIAAIRKAGLKPL